MDEILRHPQQEVGSVLTRPVYAPERTAHRKNGTVGRIWAAVRVGAAALANGVSTVWNWADGLLAGHKFISPMPFLALSGVVGAAFVIASVYTPAYVVTVDGIDLGTVTEPAVFENVVERVEDRAAAILGHDYTLDQEVEYTSVLMQKEELSPISAFETYLFNHVGEVMKSYVLTVDGKFIGAAAERSDLDGMLEQLAAPYMTENTTRVEYVEEVDIHYEYVPSDVMQDLRSMEEILAANTTGETTYEVVKGDTYLGIAYDNDMSLDELMALNPEADVDRLMIGDELTVKKTIPYLSIRTIETVNYNEEIACPVEEVEDSSMYQGTKKVLTAGTPGVANVTAEISYVNGYEDSREVITATTVSEPTVEVVAVGTKVRPKTMPTGTFKWPLSGRITSGFGYRTLFGVYEFHGGIDIANSYGTTISATDGGTVVWAGWQGSYGNLVIVDHTNGIRSYYAHCSSLLVSAGDKVYQGQAIAKVGSTGRSTGNHCHFEIRINGTRVNPRSYLP